MRASDEQRGALRVLVADDRPDVLEAMRLLLKGAGHKAETVDSPQALLRAAALGSFDLILMDLNYARDTTSGTEGLALLDRLHQQENTAPVIVMTAWGNIDLAVEAMRRGACDFIQKPWDNERLLRMLEKQARDGAQRRRAEQRARSEIEIARNVQQKLFPQKTKLLETADYVGRCVPAHEVGGDYYDFLDLGRGSMGFLLADVSGKGVAAALLMANLQGCFRSQVDRASPAALLHEVNRLFFDSTPPEQYATVFFGQYDDLTRRLRYVNCGHLPPVLARAAGAIERLEGGAMVLGIFRDWTCTEAVVDLAPGDTLIMFSDGVTEAGIEAGKEFGEERLIEMIQAGRPSALEPAIEAIVEAARGYSSAGQTDDITVVGIRAV
ncbi:MAG: SpoIIE family protein phosphatase [Bryobacteraceae bacterium]|jgi:sigma-B regulation protein RsbU (phosphoserine phosphatase)